MADDWCKCDGPRVLLVEGRTDCHVVLALCAACGVPETFGLYQCDSDDGVLRRLNALMLAPDRPRVIGVMLDADKPEACPSVSSRWDSIKSTLKRHGYDVPAQPDATGSIIPPLPNKPSVGVWLMPDNREPGMLEDFLLGMVAESAKDTVSRCIEVARTDGISSFREAHYSKAMIHTYLAWQDEPGRPLGQCITCKTLEPGTATARLFTDWLTRLFSAD